MFYLLIKVSPMSMYKSLVVAVAAVVFVVVVFVDVDVVVDVVVVVARSPGRTGMNWNSKQGSSRRTRCFVD